MLSRLMSVVNTRAVVFAHIALLVTVYPQMHVQATSVRRHLPADSALQLFSLHQSVLQHFREFDRRRKILNLNKRPTRRSVSISRFRSGSWWLEDIGSVRIAVQIHRFRHM